MGLSRRSQLNQMLSWVLLSPTWGGHKSLTASTFPGSPVASSISSKPQLS